MNKKILFLSVLIFSIIASAFYINVNISYARDDKKQLKASSYQYDDRTLTVSQNFTMLENAENKGTMTNISSIDINLGTSRWNATNIEFNITDMDFVNETKTIEDNVITGSYNKIDKFEYNCLAVQVEISASTIIYGAYIYGQNQSDFLAPKPVYFQLHGYEKATGIPNGTILRSIPLNMSKSLGEGWHLQRFLKPIRLPKGSYSLVINGTSIGKVYGYRYDWYYNIINPSYPQLNISKYEVPPAPEWVGTQPGRPFLYKLIQKVDESFYPKQINMTAEINGTDYNINDGNIINTGNLTQSFDSFYPNSTIWNIPVKNNISEALIFNLSYYIKLNNSLSVGGSVLIRENVDNIWTIEPNLDRFGYNYTVKFNYSNLWSNLNVHKDGIKLAPSGNYSDDGDILEIFNNTIIDSLIIWKITANSSNYAIDLYASKYDFKAGEILSFRVNSPAKLGNYTFVLINPVGAKKYEELKEVASPAEFFFNYTLPSSLTAGEWTAFVFWNNETDAGIQTELYQITGGGGGGGTTILPPSGDDDDSKTTTEVDYSLVIIAIIITSLVIAGGFASLTAYKRVIKIRELKKERLHNKFLDAFNLTNVIVINKKSGLNVYEQFFAGKKLDATLISGFLDAIRAFGIELTSSYEQSQSISLEYKDSKILMSEFKDFRLIFILKDRPSEEFLKSVTALSYDIDREYGELLEKFAGNLTPFQGIKGLIEHHLNTSFISPLKILDIEDIELSQAEISLIQKAKSIMKQNKLDYFFTTFLMPEQAYDPKRTELIFKLIEKKVFQPTDISFS